MLYRGMDRTALDAAYNNTAAVGLEKREQYVADWTKRSDGPREVKASRPLGARNSRVHRTNTIRGRRRRASRGWG
jgi:hypothetical protein